jgi:hypothetical protein
LAQTPPQCHNSRPPAQSPARSSQPCRTVCPVADHSAESRSKVLGLGARHAARSSIAFASFCYMGKREVQPYGGRLAIGLGGVIVRGRRLGPVQWVGLMPDGILGRCWDAVGNGIWVWVESTWGDAWRGWVVGEMGSRLRRGFGVVDVEGILLGMSLQPRRSRCWVLSIGVVASLE